MQLQLGLSFLDLASARANLEAEWKSFDFDRAREEARQAWDQALGVVEIEGGTDRQRAMFYSALYRSELMPTLFTEGGRYRGLDGEVHAAEGYTYYTDFSLWDTFRTEHPLLTLVAPARQRDFVRSLLAMTEDSGQIPKWPLATIETNTMIAYHGETVLVDSYLKGLGGFDGERAWSFIRRAALEVGAPGRQRDCMQSYSTLGYCAADQEGRSVSKTLENGFADFAAARLAEALGHAEDAALLSARSQAYAQLIHPETRFAQPRNADGSFVPGFREDFFDGAYTEGNARQWTPFVPHDVAGLARAVGGADALVSMLERIFEGAAAAEKTIFPDLWYWHGNEPDIHAAYMFAELGRPELTTRWVRWIMNARYDDTPGGLDGNDDGGTLSSWYVFSALGLFPKVAEARYVVGVPLFPAATLHLENGASVRILAPGLTETSEVRRVFWNGRALDGPFLSHAELIAGGELRFEVGP